MVRIIIRITSTPPIATRVKNSRGLDDGPKAPPPSCVREAVALCCVEVVFDVGDALVEVDDTGEVDWDHWVTSVVWVRVWVRVVTAGQQFPYLILTHGSYPSGHSISLVFLGSKTKKLTKGRMVWRGRGEVKR